jgi:hypothetical protein
VQADTVVPEPKNPQALNRYSYVVNSSLKLTDPSGHSHEQSAGYVFDPNYWRDLLLWLVREANRNVQLPEVWFMRFSNTASKLSPVGSLNKALAAATFIQLVRDTAPWDFKDAIQSDLKDRIRLGSEWFEYSTPGNIHYGFVGAAAGFSLEELHLGAGAAQFRDYCEGEGGLGTWRTDLDTEDDYYAVDFGSRLYHEAYAPDRMLSVSEFHALLVQYEDLGKMARTTEPIWPGKPDRNWPYQPGYFNGRSRPWPSPLFPSF